MRKPTKLSVILFCIAVVFIFYANFSLAQMRIGLKAGLNFSELPNNTQYIVDYNFRIGFQSGIFGEIQLSEQVFLQPGFMISTRGSKYIVGNNSVPNPEPFPDYQFSGLYAFAPLDLKYKFNLGFTDFFLNSGPCFGYGLSGRWKTSFGTSANVHFGNGVNDDLKPFDFGINFGGGFEMGQYEFSLSYYQGLKTLSPWIPAVKEEKFKIIGFSVARFLGGNYMIYFRHYKSRYASPHWKNIGPRRDRYKGTKQITFKGRKKYR